MGCPIGLDKVDCRSCCFWRDGRCDLEEILKEKDMDDFKILLVRVSRLDRAKLLILSQFINWIKKRG